MELPADVAEARDPRCLSLHPCSRGGHVNTLRGERDLITPGSEGEHASFHSKAGVVQSGL